MCGAVRQLNMRVHFRKPNLTHPQCPNNTQDAVSAWTEACPASSSSFVFQHIIAGNSTHILSLSTQSSRPIAQSSQTCHHCHQCNTRLYRCYRKSTRVIETRCAAAGGNRRKGSRLGSSSWGRLGRRFTDSRYGRYFSAQHFLYIVVMYPWVSDR